MKAQELRELSETDIGHKISGMEEEHFNLRFQHKMGQLSNPLRIRQVRRDMARARTILGEKRKSGKPAVKKPA